MATFKLTGLGAGTVAGDSLSVGQSAPGMTFTTNVIGTNFIVGGDLSTAANRTGYTAANANGPSWVYAGLTNGTLNGQLYAIASDGSTQFSVTPTLGATRNLQVTGSVAGNPTITASGGSIALGSALTTASAVTVTAGGVAVTGGTATDTLSASGQPGFQAVRITSNQSLPSGTTVIFNSTNFDTASNYGTGTGIFTVPAGHAGRYLSTVVLCIQNASGSSDTIFVSMGGVTHAITLANGVTQTISFSSISNLSVGNTISVATASVQTFTAVFAPNGGATRGCFFAVEKLN